jgi:hypothetical protein
MPPAQHIIKLAYYIIKNLWPFHFFEIVDILKHKIQLQRPFENWTVQYLKGHFAETICVQFLYGYNHPVNWTISL